MTDPGQYPQRRYPEPQYPQQQYPQQGYPGSYAAGYGQPYAPPPRGMSITSLVLGLVSIFAGFTLLVPIVGLVFGILGIKREPAGKGMATAGLILNGLMLVGWVLLAIFVLFVAGGLLATMDRSGVPA
ncbi:MAG TPA: DUF4190 domain-containing protein [Arthrobacter sp.]|nr:DUF4190 domain-containing protein [Arthrobacter sp.]